MLRGSLVVCFAFGCNSNEALPDAPATPDDARIDAYKPSCAFNPPASPTGEMAELGASDPPELTNFRSLSENDHFQVYQGPQGGYHVWINVRHRNIDLGDGSIPTRPQTKVSIFAQDGSRVNLEDCGYRFAYQAMSDNYAYLGEAWLTLLLTNFAATVDMTPLMLKIEVLDRNGKYAVDTRWVTALRPIPTPIGPPP